jgi:hypothetical protein
MKTLLKINKIALFGTLLLFLTIYLGLLAQIPLGIIQVISAVYLTSKTFAKSDYAKKHLSTYWIAAISELVLFYVQHYYFPTSNDAIEWSLMMIFPMSIAIYFYIIMKKIIEEYVQNSQNEPQLEIEQNQNFSESLKD